MPRPMKVGPYFSEESRRLRRFREEAELSRDDLASLINTNRGQIQKLETGYRKLTGQWIERIAPKVKRRKDEFYGEALPGDGNAVPVIEYDVRVSAGGGFHISDETKKDVWIFSRQYLADELRLPVAGLVVLEVIGDSMEPTLHSGDRVLVNMNDTRVSQPGIFVLWDGDGTVVKRLELIPSTKPPKLKRISDNPLHSTYEVLLEHTKVIGRVVWVARRM